MKRNERKIMLYTYGIKDTKGNKIITISFSVKFFEIDNELYLENEKSRILIEAKNERDGKKSFEEIINLKIREAISAGKLFKLLSAWNMNLQSSVEEMLENKRVEFEDYNSKVKSSVEVDLDMQMKYSSAMINRFDENSRWSSVGA